jgi:UDP-N-acetylglucosamine transferase subunit ALG13
VSFLTAVRFTPISEPLSRVRRNSRFIPGTGTVGEVLSVGAALIVVANPTLMDNHQLELAETLEEENRAVQGHLG